MRGESFDALDVDDKALLTAWCQGLDTAGGFDRFIAWIAKTLKLPVKGLFDDIRAFDLPPRPPVLRMRSLSPYSEQVGPDDGR